MNGTRVSISVAIMFATLWAISGKPPASPYTVRAVDHPFDADWPEVEWILRMKCGDCHRPGTDRTDFTSYDALLLAKNDDETHVVQPGQPDASTLFTNVVWNHSESANSSAPDYPDMPPDKEDWLTAGQLATLRRWIENGARRYREGCEGEPSPLLETDFPSARECKVCHPRQYEEWSRSMHAYAQHSPVFEAFNLTLVERTGGTIGTFCTRCHTPLGTALGENGSRRNVNRSRLSMEGVTCVVCHRLERPTYKSNTRRPIRAGRLLDACMFGPFANSTPTPGTHPAVDMPHIRSAAFCGSCHDVTNPRGTRLEEAFSEWQNSPAAREGISCQQCHMGPIQGVATRDCDRPLGRAAIVPGVDPERIPLRRLSNHALAGPDYSLLPDTEFPHKLDWMYEIDYRQWNSLTKYQQETLRELRYKNRRQLHRARLERYELLGNSAVLHVAVPPTARPGGRLVVRVDVESLVAGHNFPTGFTAERQVWVELIVTGPLGETVFQSGHVDHNGDLLNSHSHDVEAGLAKYDRHLLNFQSQFVVLANRGTERSVIIPINRDLIPTTVFRPATEVSAFMGRPSDFRVSKSSIPPLDTAGKRYKIRLPKTLGTYTVTARLNYRHLPPALFDKIGIPNLKHLLETVVIDERVCHTRVE